MSKLTRARRQPLRWSPEEDRESPAAEVPAAPRARQRPARKKEKALPLAALTVIGALSVGAVAGLAFLTADRDAMPLPRVTGSLVPAKPQPAAEPAGKATAEAKPKAQAPSVAISPAAPPPVLPAEPIRTASISTSVPLSSGFAIPALPKTPEPAAKPPEPVAKAAEPKAPEPKAPEPKAPEPVAKAAAPAAAPPPPTRLRPTLSAAEADAHLAKAETALRAGDLVVARSFFTRLAQADDPRGALGMARTYDEAELRNLPVFGLKPDRAEVERWRVRAREMTSAVARN
jgi:hypothetical protein